MITLEQILDIRSLVVGEVPRWSPDGSLILFASPLSGGTDLWSINPDGGFPVRLTHGMGDIEFLASRIPLWSPDGKYVSYISNKSGWDEVWLWPTNGQAEFQLTRLGARIHSMSWAPDSKSVVLSGNRYGRYDIYLVVIASGETTRLAQSQLYEVNPVFTPDGEHILYVRLDEQWENHEIVMISPTGENPIVVVEDEDFFDYDYGHIFGYPLVSPDGKTALFRSQRNGFINYWKVVLADGTVEPLSPENGDQSDATWSPNGQSVAYITNRNGTLGLKVLDIESGKSIFLVSPHMGTCTGPQWSPDGSLISYIYATPTTPGDIWVVDVENGKSFQITCSLLDGGVNNSLTIPQKVSYKSFDDLTIHAYLYVPQETHIPKAYPGILFIHGGPTSQFYDDYQPYIQYLVQRGYVVLAPNIRGSSGYGKAFEELNDGDWGGGDLKDVIHGAEFLKTLAFVNPNKMGVTGTSYGGNISMCAISFAPGVFQAAVPMSGYGDRPTLRHVLELRHVKQLESEHGKFENNPEVWYQISPIYKVSNATTPAFLLHGEGKYPGSSATKDFADALERHYKTVEYKSYHGENYYVHTKSNVRQMLLDVAFFFDRYLKDTLA